MLQNVLCLAVFAFSAVFAENVTVYLEEHCNNIFNLRVEDTVTIRLSRDGQAGEQNCTTQIILHPEDDAQLFASFSEFQLTPAADPRICLQHFLRLGGLAGENQDHRVCDRPPLESLNHFLFSGEKALEKTLYYSRMVPLERNDTVVLTVSNVVFTDKNGTCPHVARANNSVKDFRCGSDSLCIPNFLRCDRVANCRDGSDENDCIGTTTTEPTTTSTTTVASLSPNKEIARGGDRSQSGNSKKPHIIIGTVGGLVILALVAVIALFLVRRNKRRYHNVTTTHEPETASPNVENQEINTSLRQPEDSSV